MATKTEKSLTTIGVKEINRRLVLGALYTKEGVTKLQLVNTLEMSLSTVDQNLKELNKQGFIEELGFCGSTGGRKAKLLHLKPRLKIAVGIFILKKVVHIRALDLYGKKIAAESFALDYAKDEVYLQKLSHKFQHFLHKACILKEDLLTVRVSVQGLVAPQDEVVSYGMLLDNSGFNAKDLSVAFDCEVKLCHDSYAAAYFARVFGVPLRWSLHNKAEYHARPPGLPNAGWKSGVGFWSTNGTGQLFFQKSSADPTVKSSDPIQ